MCVQPGERTRPVNAPQDRGFSVVSAWVEYCRTHGCTSVPLAYVTPIGFHLGRWQDRQRIAGMLGTLPPRRVQELDAVGFPWVDQSERFDPVAASDSKRTTMLALLAAYREEHGHANVPANYVTDGGELLGQWLFRRIKKWRSEVLAAEELAPLVMLGVSPAPRRRGPRSAA